MGKRGEEGKGMELLERKLGKGSEDEGRTEEMG